MNIFDAVKDELSTRYVVESYGIQVRHNGMLFAILFAGAIVEVTLASCRARVGSFIFYNV